MAAPGGYLSHGGVYQFEYRDKFTMDSAKAVAKYAEQKAIEDEQFGGALDVNRGARETQKYTPTFFTQQLDQLSFRPDNARPQRETVAQQPLYYNNFPQQ